MTSHADCSVNYIIVVKIRSVRTDFLFFDPIDDRRGRERMKKKNERSIYIYINLFFLQTDYHYGVIYICIYITGLYSNYSINRITAKPQPVLPFTIISSFYMAFARNDTLAYRMVYTRARCRILLYTRTDNRIYIIYF